MSDYVPPICDRDMFQRNSCIRATIGFMSAMQPADQNMLAVEYARGRLKWDYVSNGESDDRLETAAREVA